MKTELRNIRPAVCVPCLVLVGARTVGGVAVGGDIVASLPDLYDATDELLSRCPVGTLVVRECDRVPLRVVMPSGWVPGEYRVRRNRAALGERKAAA